MATLQRELRRQTGRLKRLTAQLARNQINPEVAQAALAEIHSSLSAARPAAVEPSGYQQLIRRIRSVVRKELPRDATVIVVSKGDPELLKLSGRTAWHFPRTLDGQYAGYHPACSTAAIAQLETLRAQAGQYLLLPSPSFWWLEHYSAFRQHLEQRYRLVVRCEDTCLIYSLREPASANPESATVQFGQLAAGFVARFEREPAILDWQSGMGLAQMFPQLTVFSSSNNDGPLPYLDRSVDIVVTGLAKDFVAGEARRVAVAAVATASRAGSNGEPNLEVQWLPGCPASRLQKTSIIIPCHNGRALTDACLRSLLETLPHGFHGEIIVVDDASGDRTAASLKHWAKQDARVKILRNRRNLGFVDTCNRGAAAASGEILIFLNNDLVLLPGWLSPLLRVFRNFPDAGVVGGKLIFPDGTLQEAGGVVFGDGSAMNFGRGDTELDAPLYNFVREVDYCSGALFATRRALFNKLGGFDTKFRPGYYEDTDYCFKARKCGFRVYYQPEGAVVHREGGTAGTDVSRGMKRYQVINQAKFKQRWKSALLRQPPRPNKVDAAALLALSVRDAGTEKRPRALVCSLMPEYDRDSGSRRVYDLLNFLQEAGWAVSFVSHHEKYVARYAQTLQQRGIAVYGGSGRRMKELVGAGRFDLAVFGLWHIAEPYIPAIRALSPATRVIVDSIDLHFLRLARGIFLTKAQNGSIQLLDTNYASEMMREVNTYAASDAVLTVSQKEAGLINDLVADPALAHAVPDNEELSPSAVKLAERRGMVFIGCFRHAPNIDAVEFLCQEILPQLDPALLEQHPVYIVGDGVNDEVRALAKGLPNVKIVGWVPTVLPYLERARISLIPLRFGAGTKRKMLQTLLVGTPAVSTSIGIEGLNLCDAKHVLVADDPEHFASSIARLLKDAALWKRLAQRGRKHIAAVHGRQVARQSLQQVIANVMAHQPKRILPGDAEVEVKTGRMPYLEYHQLATRLAEAVRATVPENATVMVVSKGDDALRELDGRQGWHFPRAEDGTYAGYYPADSAAAISHLEKLRDLGGEFLLFPSTAFWWLDHYAEFRQHLETQYRQILRQPDTCVIFDLRSATVEMIPASDADVPTTTPMGDGELRDVKLIAFHLPQFHPIPENDAWWGKGFTEWTNVAKARALFPGHYQPHIPSDLGFYDLRLAEVRQAQADLAREHGIHGFCFYHYWFGGKRLLELPFNEMLASGKPDFPFCLCWANEPWSRRWNGRPEEVLQAQNYNAKDDVAHIRWLLPALADQRAIRIEGKAVFLVYQGRDLPNPSRTVERWRREVERAGLPGIYLLSVETGWDAGWDATKVGFDAKVLFQPQFTMLFNAGAQIPIPGRDKLRVFDYQKAWPVLAKPDPVRYRRYDTVFPSWDNSPRAGENGVILHNSSPAAYQQWLALAIAKAMSQPPDHRIVFVNAWNEWGEGCHLEPDSCHGRAYLEATRRALMSGTRSRATATAATVGATH